MVEPAAVPYCRPRVVTVFKDLALAPGSTATSETLENDILNIALRIQSTGTAGVQIQEPHDREGWSTTGSMEVLEGETVWHYTLKQDKFRIRVENGSGDRVAVTIQANLPCRAEAPQEMVRRW